MKMNRMKMWFLMAMMAGGMLAFTSCDNKNGSDDNGGDDVVAGDPVLKGEIKGNRTLSADTVYTLDGFVYVVDGATLTIPAGTVIQGKSGTKAALIVERGGKLMAEGTAEDPIIFTSDKPAGQRNYGDWGGVILCGKAKINSGEAQVEGGPRTMYGGEDDHDNSGVLKYVRIEFGGIEFDTDKEINGLTICAVGDATVIDHVQCSYTKDDSFEWFGGTVNCRNLVAFRGWDDDFDTDAGFRGTVQFAVSVRDIQVSDKSKSNGFESDNDGDGSSNTPLNNPRFSNVTLIGPYATLADTANTNSSFASDNAYGPFQAAMHLRRNTRLQVYNSVFAGWPLGLLLDSDNCMNSAEAGISDPVNNLVVKNCILAGMRQNFDQDVESATLTTEEYFNNAALNNRVVATNAELGIAGAFNLASPSFLPESGSALLSGADFSGLTGFETVNFIGAFGTEDWTAGWCNFDPQNTEYVAAAE